MTTFKGNSLTNEEIDQIVYEAARDLLAHLESLTSKKGGEIC